MMKTVLPLLLLVCLTTLAAGHLEIVDIPVWEIPPPLLAPPALYENARQARLAGRAVQDDVFTYTFEDESGSSSLTNAIRDAVRFAGKIISHRLNVTGPGRDIRVQVRYRPLFSSGNSFVLGSAAPFTNCQDTLNGNLLTPSSLWRFKYGGNACTSQYDMLVSLTDKVDFYTGLDGNAPTDKFDLVTVMAHEMLHAMGVQSLMKCHTSNNSCTNYPFAHNNLFDNITTNNGVFVNPNDASDAAQTAFATGNNGFADTPEIRANGASPASLYLPAVYQPGSSIAHLSLSYNGGENAMMVPSLSRGVVRHSIGGIIFQMLRSFGYSMNECSSHATCDSCTQGFCEWCVYDNTCGSSKLSPYQGTCSTTPGFISNQAFCSATDGGTVASATSTAAATTTGTTEEGNCEEIIFFTYCPAAALAAASPLFALF